MTGLWKDVFGFCGLFVKLLVLIPVSVHLTLMKSVLNIFHLYLTGLWKDVYMYGCDIYIPSVIFIKILVSNKHRTLANFFQCHFHQNLGLQ